MRLIRGVKMYVEVEDFRVYKAEECSFWFFGVHCEGFEERRGFGLFLAVGWKEFSVLANRNECPIINEYCSQGRMNRSFVWMARVFFGRLFVLV